KGIVPPTTPPDPEAPGPFSFGDRGRVARILTAAGFTDIAIAPFNASVPFGEGATRDAAIDDAVKMTLEVGPLSRGLADQPDDIRARASAAVRAAFAGRPGERSVMIDGAAWVVTARNPPSRKGLTGKESRKQNQSRRRPGDGRVHRHRASHVQTAAERRLPRIRHQPSCGRRTSRRAHPAALRRDGRLG